MASTTDFQGQFDYIVVGSGSAGGVVANRLAKSGKYSVLLLEAGPTDFNPLIHMPGGTAEVLKSKRTNWNLDSEPQVHLNNRRLTQHRGKMLGGSSNINGMVAIRGNAADYDHWAALGNDGWAYKDVLNNFKAIETWCGGVENEYHGSQGECHINLTHFEDVSLRAVDRVIYGRHCFSNQSHIPILLTANESHPAFNVNVLPGSIHLPVVENIPA